MTMRTLLRSTSIAVPLVAVLAWKGTGLSGRVTKDDVLAVAKKYLHPESVLLVAVADQNVAKIKSANVEKPAASAGGE